MWKTAVDTRVMDHFCDETCPASLVGCAEPTACVPVKELVEPQVTRPVLVVVEFVVPIIAGTTAVVAFGEDMLEAMLKLFCNVPQMHILARACRTLDLQRITIVNVEPEEGFNEEEIDAKPDRL